MANKDSINSSQLKARRTNLDKKERDELINIILRKDSTERKNNAKIQKLTELLKEADELNEAKATRIFNFDKDMDGMEDKLHTKQEQLDDVINKLHIAETIHNDSIKEISRLEIKCSLLKKVILFCIFVIIAVSIIAVIL